MGEHKYKEAYDKGYEEGKKHAFDGWVEQCYDELPRKEQIELLMKQGAKLPTAEPQTAEWIWDENRIMYVCSKCKGNPTEGTGYSHGYPTLVSKYHYCKSCGAKMKGDKE